MGRPGGARNAFLNVMFVILFIDLSVGRMGRLKMFNSVTWVMSSASAIQSLVPPALMMETFWEIGV